ncbi:MAG: OmpA family protein [Paraburkholderia sp.]|nr:OmpA family protein [Paraburkholderia sp.]
MPGAPVAAHLVPTPPAAVNIGGQEGGAADAGGANAAGASGAAKAANGGAAANNGANAANANAKAGAGATANAEGSAGNAANASAPAQLYFAPGSASLDAQSATALAAIAQRLAASPETRVVISGYTDSSGSYAQNERLAHARAATVRSALIVAGVQDARIEMRKPAKIVATDPADKSRRVDVTLSSAAGG